MKKYGTPEMGRFEITRTSMESARPLWLKRNALMEERNLSQLLWRIDPMGTGCAINEGMEGEYEGVARDIAHRLSQGQDAQSAVVAEFDGWYWEGCLSPSHRQDCLAQIVSALTNEG